MLQRAFSRVSCKDSQRSGLRYHLPGTTWYFQPPKSRSLSSWFCRQCLACSFCASTLRCGHVSKLFFGIRREKKESELRLIFSFQNCVLGWPGLEWEVCVGIQTAQWFKVSSKIAQTGTLHSLMTLSGAVISVVEISASEVTWLSNVIVKITTESSGNCLVNCLRRANG